MVRRYEDQICNDMHLNVWEQYHFSPCNEPCSAFCDSIVGHCIYRVYRRHVHITFSIVSLECVWGWGWYDVGKKAAFSEIDASDNPTSHECSKVHRKFHIQNVRPQLFKTIICQVLDRVGLLQDYFFNNLPSSESEAKVCYVRAN